MGLYPLLRVQRDVILERWKASVLGRVAPESLPALELLDHFPAFLNEVIAKLRLVAADDAGPDPDDSATAAGHGEQRLRLGFSLDSVVREYDALREAIEDTAVESGIVMTLAEARCLSRSITSGVATAVSEYARQRDAELYRQHNEHVAFIAHELRNPLATIALAIDMLFREGHLSMTLPPSRAIARALEHTQSLVDNVLQVARVSSGVELKREHTTLRELVEDTELLATTDADAFGVSLHVDIERDVELFVDARLVRSALSNLVRNALKYSHRGGVVEVRGRVSGQLALVEIEDACGGLEPGMVERAFAPFVRLDNEKSGFGLGLAIAKQAVDAHAGTLRVQNVPGKGCIFVMELPFATHEALPLVGS
jgi:signal transduction histidine kinase